MARFAGKPVLRASFVYVGSALLLAAGAVTVADQPFNNRQECGCKTPVNWNASPRCDQGQNCWQAFGTPCIQIACTKNINNQTGCPC
jgi:hypothetical protein